MSATKIDNRNHKKMGRVLVEVFAFIDVFKDVYNEKLVDLAVKFGCHSPWSFQYL